MAETKMVLKDPRSSLFVDKLIPPSPLTNQVPHL